ncbi:hypothetical protein PC129_g16600 [Phytophthora cactorum]|uniref:Uncharacterized protein n=1 Tax=Phytophthora cactorum TaxID=29920 RepID=A0A329RJZ8_9STRA|nr:hypothetical protein PC114_g19662 [Phytophthora cactorum]KAG2896566.1 hypothetical protein PC115_g17484 [Phytophthora cactorum]KAG2911428.1 hypothetical protein PC117_g19181 [Phytophthora cactorum]KAG2968858.1 hypothetical protein PC118_g17757 [Phytophthora cactorum]KAG2989932.1 hypothetical protein PC119_g19205 [Phytophthora cactorum]
MDAVTLPVIVLGLSKRARRLSALRKQAHELAVEAGFQRQLWVRRRLAAVCLGSSSLGLVTTVQIRNGQKPAKRDDFDKRGVRAVFGSIR